MVGSRQPIAHSDLMRDRISRGEMREEKSTLVRPRSNLSSSYNQNLWVFLKHFFLFFWNISTFPVLIDYAMRKVKSMSSHHRLLEVRTSRVPHVLGEIYIELQDDLGHERRQLRYCAK